MDVLIFGCGAAAGYGLAIYTWAAVRAVLLGADQELASLKARAAALEAKLRAALGKGA
jgi:hypothetical protein